MKYICKSDSTPIDIGLPSGATGITLLSPVTGLSIDAETGQIVINWATFVLGIYKLVIKYTLGGSDFTFILDISAVECKSKPIVTTYNLCKRSTNYTFQILFSDGSTYTDVTLASTVDFVTVSSTGLLTIETGITDPTTITVLYGAGKSQAITINPITCQTVVESDLTECEKDSIGISWINQEGGRQSFYFNQPKDFGIAQNDGQTYINKSREKRYFTRGEVNDTVAITQQFIPIEFVTSINSLKNAIQSWAFTDIDTQSTYQSIILDEDTWVFKRTTDRYYTLSFKFSYSKAKVIQKQ